MKSKRKKIFIGLNDIANIPMMFKKAFEENDTRCDYYTWSNLPPNMFGYQIHKTFFQFNNPPPFRIFGRNPFWIINTILRCIYLFYSIFRYNYFIFISPRTFFLNNKDLYLIKILKKKVIIIFTGCMERDINFAEGDEDYVCRRCQDTSLQKWCFCIDIKKKKERVQRLEKYSDVIIGQDDITSFVNDKSKLIWLYLISDYPKFEINLSAKYNQKEIRIIHFPSNPLVKQSHIIIPILNKFSNNDNIKVIIKDGVWMRERIEDELSKAHILVNALGTGYNTLPIEAMSYGCVVMNSHPEWFKINVMDAPIYPISAASLYSDIEYLINNRTVLKNYAEKSLEYYFKYHTPKSAGSYYLNKFE